MAENYQIHHFKEIGSTNQYALMHLDQLNDRDIIIADVQTNGYGRFKRKWVSDEPENLYFSLVLKPKDRLKVESNWQRITTEMAAAVIVVLKQYIESSVEVKMKYPNDIFVDNQKIAGILAESKVMGNQIKGIVIGVGINLNMPNEKLNQIDQKATSLHLYTKEKIDKIKCCKDICSVFMKNSKLM